MVKKVTFEKSQLKCTNYKNGYHIYKKIETVADKPDTGIPDSVINLLYRIYFEGKTTVQTTDDIDNSTGEEGGDAA